MQQILSLIKSVSHSCCIPQSYIHHEGPTFADALNRQIEKMIAQAKAHPLIDTDDMGLGEKWATIAYVAGLFHLTRPLPPPEVERHPMNIDVIRDLSVYVYNTRRDKWFRDQCIDTTCSICQSDFTRGDQVLHLMCQHFFHRECLFRWFEQSNTCPLCRTVLDDQQIVDFTYRQNGISLIHICTACEENIDKLIKLEKKIGRWGILNCDAMVYNELVTMQHDIFEQVDQIRRMHVKKSILSLRNTTLVKLEILSCDIHTMCCRISM
jgi:hypothetical protein